jgi:tRNA uridine 5-carboxymethylaminomethyl modification enzyme
MFTSRAEFRLRLRADNSDLRLTPIGMDLGCIGHERRKIFLSRLQAVEQLRNRLRNNNAPAASLPDVRSDGAARTLWEWARFPGVDWTMLRSAAPDLDAPADIVETVLTDARYAVYVDRQEAEVSRLKRDDAVVVPRGTIFAAIPGVSREMAERLEQSQPETLGQAARIRGISPAALTALLAWIRRREAEAA